MEAYGGAEWVRFRMLFEEHRDLFAMPQLYSLVHCGAADLDFRRSVVWVLDKFFVGHRELMSYLPTIVKLLEIMRNLETFYVVT